MKQLLLVCALIGQSVLATEKSRVMAMQVGDQKLAYSIQAPDPKKVKPKQGLPLQLFPFAGEGIHLLYRPIGLPSRAASIMNSNLMG